jgi:hypothetical protein
VVFTPHPIFFNFILRFQVGYRTDTSVIGLREEPIPLKLREVPVISVSNLRNDMLKNEYVPENVNVTLLDDIGYGILR